MASNVRSIIRYSATLKKWMWYDIEQYEEGGKQLERVISEESLDTVFNIKNSNLSHKVEDFVHLIIGVDKVLDTIPVEDVISFYGDQDLLSTIGRKSILQYLRENQADDI